MSGTVGPRRIGPIALGMPETKVWAELGTPARVKRGFLRFCVPGGGKLMVGVPGDRSGLSGGPGQGRAVVLLTTHRGLNARGVGAGDAAARLARAFPRARAWFAAGTTRYVRLGRGLLAGIEAGRVRLLAAYDPSRIRGRRAVHDWLHRST